MSAGMPSLATAIAFSNPPAEPASSAVAAAAVTGRFQSRYAIPKTTAESPIIEPTERSMPPMTRTGVIATASSKTAEHDRPVNGWTLDEIAATIINEAHAAAISRATEFDSAAWAHPKDIPDRLGNRYLALARDRRCHKRSFGGNT